MGAALFLGTVRRGAEDGPVASIEYSAYEEMVEAGGRVAEVMRAFRTFLGESDMMAYLAMMAPRLVDLRRVLREAGSIYLHCDPTASHYLKMLMDAVFDPRHFRNEIIWQRALAKGLMTVVTAPHFLQ